MVIDDKTPMVINDETPIWRYMDLPKFVSMLATEGLWFPRASKLEDPNEGFGKAVPREIPSDEHGPKRLLGNPERRGESVLISHERLFAELSHWAAEPCNNARDLLYLNSWCFGCESMAMWKIYGSLGYGIAVKSSIGQYKRAASFPVLAGQCDFRKVEYHDDLGSCKEIQHDFSDSVPGKSGVWKYVLEQGFHKHSCYSYEQEWRAALCPNPQPPERTGVHVEFDLEQLISAVYLGPKAEDFFVDAVSSVMSKVKVFTSQKPLMRSTLLHPLSEENMVVY